jgi:beta-glucanase (GH16 family)
MLAVAVLSGALVVGCGGGSSNSSGTGGTGGGTTTPTTATPTFTPAAGTYSSAQSVSITDSTAGATIYYTTDGTTPTTASSVYSKPITISATTTLEALATATGDANSAVASGIYTITLPAAATPTFTPAAGSYSSVQSVTINDTTVGATIYYTTDGSTPTTSSSVYSTPITISSSTTLKAIAAATGDSNSAVASAAYTITLPAATPSFATTAALAGAEIVTLTTATNGATIYYTIDGTTPTTSSILYASPFLVASDITVNAIAVASGVSNSAVASQTFSPDIPSGTLVWSDEFANSTSSPAAPNSEVWNYDTGGGGWGNGELENYCAWGSNASPCSASAPNAFVDTTGLLNIVAEQPSTGVYTSARMKTEGLFAFQYGRIEARIKVPESQGMWPAFWLLGSNINSIPWPACGESDIMEHIDGSNPPINGSGPGYDWAQSSIHGTNLNGGAPYTTSGFSAAAWHTYGMIWSKGQVQFYIDNEAAPYETFKAASQAGTWPFDSGPQFILLNLAVGGSWPGNPDSTTVLPATMQVDYVRIYTN